MRFRDLSIQYKHYDENSGILGEGNDPLIIQRVPLWAKTEESMDAGGSLEIDASEGTLEEGEYICSVLEITKKYTFSL